MLKFIVSRFLQGVTILFVIVTLAFFMARLTPGGPFTGEKTLPPEVLKQLNAHYGYDDPLFTQYTNYLGRILHGDLGPSTKYLNRSVNELIAESAPVTFQLGLFSLLIALIIGIPAGAIAAVKRNTKLDYVPMSASMIGICMPTFVMGPVLALVFGLWLGWFNVSGVDSFADLVLPAMTLGLYYAGYVARLTRGGMLEILSQDFIRTARAKGVPERTIILRHALKGGLLPVISFMGPALAGLISGSFVVETVFNIPGLGRFFVAATFNRDFAMIGGTTLLFGVLIITFNLAADIVLALLNPKLRHR